MKKTMVLVFLCLMAGLGTAQTQLKVDFSQTGDPVQAGYQGYFADHEQPARRIIPRQLGHDILRSAPAHAPVDKEPGGRSPLGLPTPGVHVGDIDRRGSAERVRVRREHAVGKRHRACQRRNVRPGVLTGRAKKCSDHAAADLLCLSVSAATSRKRLGAAHRLATAGITG